MLSYRKLKIGNVGQPVILVHVTLFSLSWSFLTKNNENGFGFLDFLPCQFLCAWAWGEHVVLELKLYFEDTIYLRKKGQGQSTCERGLLSILNSSSCLMIGNDDFFVPWLGRLTVGNLVLIYPSNVFFFLLQVQDANLVHSQLPWRVSRLLLLV